jgi:hypothetical protein
MNNFYYGGKTKIIPLELDQFMCLVDKSYNNASQPTPRDIQRFLDMAIAQVSQAENENDWSDRIQGCVDSWLVV